LNYLDRNMITTMRDSLTEAIPMNAGQFGLLTTVFLVVYGFLSPLGGFLADRFSRSRVIVGSLLVWSLMTWLTGHAQTFGQLIAARAVMGLSEACYIPAALALIADYHRGPTRSLATGIHMTGIMVGSAMGGLGGWLAAEYGWSFAFTVFGLFGCGYAVVLGATLRDAPEDSQEGPAASEEEPKVDLLAALASLMFRLDFLALLLFWCLLGVANWGVVVWMPTYMNEHFQLGQAQGGFAATLFFFIPAFFGVLFGGFWADRWSRRTERARVWVPFIGLCVAAPAILVTAMAPSHLLPVAVAGLVLYGFTRSFTDSNVMPILCLIADPRYRATGYGVLNMFSCLGGGLMAYAGGWIMDQGIALGTVFLIAAGIVLLCAMLLLVVRPRTAEAAPQPSAD
jgi:MFS family permease